MKYPQLVSMPSAVSDWLEEQLEARGIDAVVYTRYILSLLHTDSVDVILPDDEELHFSQLKKEIKRSNGSRKRIRRSTEWWKNGHVDPEKIKRLAAVECLMSASEQTFGIESLVDELCEKLKAIKSETSPTHIITAANPSLTKTTNIEQQQQNCVILSPQELAKRYYAAFPPLSRNNNKNNTSLNSPTKLITTLAPKWIQSPTKQTKKQPPPTIMNNRKNNNNNNKEDKIVNMKARSTIVGNKQRYNNYFNRNDNNWNRKDGAGRSLMKSVEGMYQWDLSLFINNNRNNSKLTTIINDWPKNIENSAPISISSSSSSSSLSITDEHCLNNNDEWNIEDDLNMYEDLPVDISDLLDDSSPSSTIQQQQQQHDETVELMNIANMRDTGKRGFIQSGTNLTTSIWSNDDITSEFGSITINTNNNWIIKNDIDNDNRKNTTIFDENNWDYVLPNEKWSDIDDNSSNNPIVLSLIKLNHCKETSPFVEVCPKPKPQSYELFKQISITTTTTTTVHPSNNGDNILQNTPIRTIDIDSSSKDDLLTSTSSHFRPIKEPINHLNNTNNNNNNNNNHLQKQYEYSDGTTFTISRNFDQINYRRTNSGGLYLENDYAMKRKYYEYNSNNNNSNLTTIPSVTTTSTNYGLVLKFIVCQNDKECQTDDFLVGVTEIQETIINNISNNNNYKGSYHISNNSNNDKNDGSIVKCTCLSNEKMQQAMITDYSLGFIICPQHSQDDDSDNKSLMAEIIWKKQDNSSGNKNSNNKKRVCEKCTNSVMWNTEECMMNFDCNNDGIWDDKNLHSIWSGGEVCYSCLGRPPSTLQQTKLREDISQDGDQLLSDLSSLQRSYMMENNELSSLTTTQTQLTETSYDINELLLTKDKKHRRRHSLIMAINNNNNNNNSNIINNNNNDNTIDESGIWSFASRLEEDCLIQMSTIPTLRSVTL